MKKRELKNRIERGFSELAPDIFEAVMEAAEIQKAVFCESKSNETEVQAEENPKINPNHLFLLKGRFIKYALSICGVLALALLCMSMFFSNKKDSIYIVLDINPSIQVEMDKSYQVKGIKGLNEDGKSVVEEIVWKKKESVQDLMDTIIQDVVEKSYLRKNEGILVTLSAADKNICSDLTDKLGERIDKKLTELDVQGVTTAFQKVESGSSNKGRKVLEKELAKNYGLNQEQAEKMSVMELIQYCQDNTQLKLDFSKSSAIGQETSKGKEKVSKEQQTQSKTSTLEETTTQAKQEHSEDEEKSLEDESSEDISRETTVPIRDNESSSEDYEKPSQIDTGSAANTEASAQVTVPESTQFPVETTSPAYSEPLAGSDKTEQEESGEGALQNTEDSSEDSSTENTINIEEKEVSYTIEGESEYQINTTNIDIETDGCSGIWNG